MDYLQRGINRCIEPCGGGGGITAGDNVGAGTGEVFRDITGGNTFNLRTLLSPTGTVSIVTNGDVVEFEATASNIGGAAEVFAGQVGADKQFRTLTSSGSVTITQNASTISLEVAGSAPTGATFVDSGADIDFTLADATLVSQVVANVSARGTAGAISGDLTTYQIICGSNGTTISPASDIIQVDGASALTTVSLSVVQSGNDINIRFARTGAGDNVQLFYSVQTLPLT